MWSSNWHVCPDLTPGARQRPWALWGRSHARPSAITWGKTVPHRWRRMPHRLCPLRPGKGTLRGQSGWRSEQLCRDLAALLAKAHQARVGRLRASGNASCQMVSSLQWLTRASSCLEAGAYGEQARDRLVKAPFLAYAVLMPEYGFTVMVIKQERCS